MEKTDIVIKVELLDLNVGGDMVKWATERVLVLFACAWWFTDGFN